MVALINLVIGLGLGFVIGWVVGVISEAWTIEKGKSPQYVRRNHV